MNGYIIETLCERLRSPGRLEAVRWIGVAKSAAGMIALLPGQNPSVVDRGPEVLKAAQRLGLSLGEFRRHEI
jgi:hypothetical protein